MRLRPEIPCWSRRCYAGPANRELSFGGRGIQLIGAAGAAATILDCEGLGRGFFLVAGEEATARITGFTIRNGDSRGWAGEDRGGGLLIYGSSPTIADLIIEDCFAPANGGGAHVQGGHPSFSDLVIRRCGTTPTGWPGDDGGGLWCGSGSIGITRGLIVDNHSPHHGGGILVGYGAQLALTQVTIAGNRAAGGGGLCLDTSTSAATLDACCVAANEAAAGGGLQVMHSQAVLGQTCCDVYGNDGGDYGGYADDMTGVGGNIAGDPAFCDPGIGDYHVASHSPCLPGNNGCAVQIGGLGWGCSLVGLPDPETPAFWLGQNHPNPFNPRTTIDFSVPTAGLARVLVYGVDGRRVATLVDRHIEAGPHEIVWNGRDDSDRRLPSGIYYARLEAGGQAATLKLLLMK